MTRYAFLEAFDFAPPEAEAEPPAGPSPDWLDGHAAGYEAGRAAALAHHAALTSELVAVLADLDFAGAEARRVVLDGLQPLFVALVERFVPEAAQASFAPRLAAEISAIAAADSEAPLVLRLAPAAAREVGAALAELTATRVRIAVDPALGPLEAVMSIGGTETGLDHGRLTEDLTAILANLIESPQELRNHG